MKIAIASPDGSQVFPHFGRSPHFLVVNVEEGKIVGKQLRSNPFAGHEGAHCHDESGHGGEEAGHGTIVSTLRDCSAVLCYGMGNGAADALIRFGIQPYLLGERCTTDDAVGLFLQGKLARLNQGFCHCHR